MMDIEKLIEQLKWWAEECDRTNFGCQAKKTLKGAATALSTLQAENEKLKNKLSELAHLPFDEPGIGERTRLMAENAQLLAKLEQVKRDRDAAEDCINQIQHARDHTRPAYIVDQILSDWRGPEEG